MKNTNAARIIFHAVLVQLVVLAIVAAGASCLELVAARFATPTHVTACVDDIVVRSQPLGDSQKVRIVACVEYEHADLFQQDY